MRVVEIIQRPTDIERRRMIDFVEQTGQKLGARPLSDHLWLDLNGGHDDGFVVATVSDESGVVALAQVSSTNDSVSLEVVLDPDLADPQQVRDDIVETVVGSVRHRGGAMLFWWVDDPGPSEVALAETIGLRPSRELFEMRRSLPLDRHAAVTTRSFVVGQDEAAWIAVNNRAFADHGEQGGWGIDTLSARIAESWFDADGFRLYERDGRVAAFCWTKLHSEHDPALGEIYVIAVDPDFHGLGLGKQLTLAGLDSIASRGITTAMLYVDAGNTAAVTMYEQLGFATHRKRQAFAGELTSTTEGTR